MATIHSAAPKQVAEVWVRVRQSGLGVDCTAIFEDESVEALEAQSFSIRGGQRAATGVMVDAGWVPSGRWSIEHTDTSTGEDLEASRRFLRS